MAEFREHTPVRQKITKKVTNHKEHTTELRKDFKNRCGYCNDIKIGNAVFEVDHFIPKNPRDFTTTIDPTDYSNLVYSCMSCNRAKSNKWPTNNETVHNKDNKGFIDPCNKDYNKQFKRTNEGRIFPDSELGKWMYYALKLHKPQHEILWLLNQLNTIKQEIYKLIDENTDIMFGSDIINIFREYDKYENKLSYI